MEQSVAKAIRRFKVKIDHFSLRAKAGLLHQELRNSKSRKAWLEL